MTKVCFLANVSFIITIFMIVTISVTNMHSLEILGYPKCNLVQGCNSHFFLSVYSTMIVFLCSKQDPNKRLFNIALFCYLTMQNWRSLHWFSFSVRCRRAVASPRHLGEESSFFLFFYFTHLRWLCFLVHCFILVNKSMHRGWN